MSSSRWSGFRHLHGRGPRARSYAFLSAVAGAGALASAGAILRVRQVR